MIALTHEYYSLVDDAFSEKSGKVLEPACEALQRITLSYPPLPHQASALATCLATSSKKASRP